MKTEHVIGVSPFVVMLIAEIYAMVNLSGAAHWIAFAFAVGCTLVLWREIRYLTKKHDDET